jgi:hypothetical protein
MPVPDIETVDGEFVALLVIVTLPVWTPIPCGAKSTVRTADWLGPIFMPSETPLTLKPVPETATPEIVTAKFPLSVKVVFREPMLPTATLPSLRLAGLEEIASVAIIPDPLRDIETVATLLPIETEPWTAPVTVGEKATLNVVTVFDGREKGSARPVIVKPAPEIVALETVTIELPMFFN